MANKRSYSKKKKPQSKKKRYSANEKRAYWIGVGISVERHAERDRFLDHSNKSIRESAIAGYEADNHRNVSDKVR